MNGLSKLILTFKIKKTKLELDFLQIIIKVSTPSPLDTKHACNQLNVLGMTYTCLPEYGMSVSLVLKEI